MSDSLFRRALDTGIAARQKYGDVAQDAMLVEECGELLTALAREKRGRCTRCHVEEEIADVLLVALGAVNEFDTLPRNNIREFMVRIGGEWKRAWWNQSGQLCATRELGHFEGRIEGWDWAPDADSRVVTRAELEKLISAAIRFGSCSQDAMPKFQAALDSAKKSVGLE